MNPKKTKAILIGVSKFQDKSFIDAEPIKNNVQKLAELFKDEDILGLKSSQILVLDKNEKHDEILRKIDEFVSVSYTETVIFYFAGHGYRTTNGNLYLVTNNTNKKFVDTTSISWNNIKTLLEQDGKGIQQRLYILDACHSGAATLGENNFQDIPDGSALIAAADAKAKAYFDEKAKYTYFTEAFIDILENGIDKEEQKGLDFNSIVDNLEHKLRNKNFTITPKTTKGINDAHFFLNKKYDKENAIRNSINKLIKQADYEADKGRLQEAVKLYIQARNKAQKDENFNYLAIEIQTKINNLENDIATINKFNDKKVKKRILWISVAVITLGILIWSLSGSDEKEEPIIIEPTQESDIIIPEMVKISGGTFQMGQPDPNINGTGWTDSEQPVHNVTVSDFYIDKYEVTHKEYIYFLNAINCGSDGSYNRQELINMDDSDCAVGYKNGKFYFKGSDYAEDILCPVIEVTWYGANEYCKWLSKKTGKTYRLPTEAEWEYAAGGGSIHQKWAGTNSESSLSSYAWYGNSGSKTHRVGTKSPNQYGLYDMSGNVWEWCSDWYSSDYYSSSPSLNPQGASSGSFRVIRGGSWCYAASCCRVAFRFNDYPVNRGNYIGFRVVADF